MTTDSTNTIIIYQDDNEVTNISVRFAEEDLWLTQNQLSDIYCTTQQNIAQHISNIYKDGELTEATHKKFLLVQIDETYRKREMESLESDFDRVIKQLHKDN